MDPTNSKKRHLPDGGHLCYNEHKEKKTKDDIDYISLMPEEIFLHIISFIDQPSSLSLLGRVARRWNNISRDKSLWRVFCSKFFPDSFKHSLFSNTDMSNTYEWFKSQYLFQKRLCLNNLRTSSFSGMKFSSCKFYKKTVLAASEEGELLFWNMEKGWKKITQFENFGEITHIIPIENKIALVSMTGLLAICDLMDEKKSQILNCCAGEITDVKVVDDEIFISSYDGTVRIWNVDSGDVRILNDEGSDNYSGSSSPVMCFLVHNKNLFMGTKDGVIYMWDHTTGRKLASEFFTEEGRKNRNEITCLSLTNDRIFGGDESGVASCWSLEEPGKLLKEIVLHPHKIIFMQPWGNSIVSASDISGEICLWDGVSDEGEILDKDIQNTTSFSIAAFLIYDNLLYYATIDNNFTEQVNTLFIFDLTTKKTLKMLKFPCMILSIEVFHQQIICFGGGGEIIHLDYRN